MRPLPPREPRRRGLAGASELSGSGGASFVSGLLSPVLLARVRGRLPSRRLRLPEQLAAKPRCAQILLPAPTAGEGNGCASCVPRLHGVSHLSCRAEIPLARSGPVRSASENRSVSAGSTGAVPRSPAEPRCRPRREPARPRRRPPTEPRRPAAAAGRPGPCSAPEGANPAARRRDGRERPGRFLGSRHLGDREAQPMRISIQRQRRQVGARETGSTARRARRSASRTAATSDFRHAPAQRRQLPGEPGSRAASPKRDPPATASTRLRRPAPPHGRRRWPARRGGRPRPGRRRGEGTRAGSPAGRPAAARARRSRSAGLDHVDERRAAGKLGSSRSRMPTRRTSSGSPSCGQQRCELGSVTDGGPETRSGQALVLARYLAGEPRQAGQNASDVGSRAHQRRPASGRARGSPGARRPCASDVIMELPP